MHLDQPCNCEADNQQQSAHSPQYANNNNNNNNNNRNNKNNNENIDITNKKLLSETESVNINQIFVYEIHFILCFFQGCCEM